MAVPVPFAGPFLATTVEKYHAIEGGQQTLGKLAAYIAYNDPGVQLWMKKWSELQSWVFPQQFFRENLKPTQATQRILW